MKKIAYVLIIALFISLLTPLVSSAASPVEIPDGLYDYLKQQILEMNGSISLSNYNINADQAGYVFSKLRIDEPLLFMLTGRIQYGVNPQTKQVVLMVPEYRFGKEEYTEKLTWVNDELDNIIDSIPEGLNDFEKALYLHDYICLNYEYDTSFRIHNLYDLLNEKTGVCDAYSMLYIALLSRVGITAHGVTSDEINHAWCEIKLGDSWYYVDVTWDDPVPDTLGFAEHKYFLISSTKLTDHGSDYVPIYNPDDNRYDNSGWHEVSRRFAFANGDVYCIKDFTISKVNIDDDEYTEIYQIDDNWHAVYQDGTHVCFSGLEYYAGHLLFNTDKSIVALNIADEEVTEIITLETNNKIYGMYVNGDTVYYVTASHPNLPDGVVLTADLSELLNVKVVLSGIEIVSAPSKTEYFVGEEFDPTGLSVLAHYSDGTSAEITEYTLSVNGPLSLDETEVTVSYAEEEITVSGSFSITVSINEKCGEKLTWSYGDGVLTVSGEGAMYDYDAIDAPWNFTADTITSVIICDGVTTIGANAFSSFAALKTVSIESSVTSIGNGAFDGCTELSRIYGREGSAAESFASDNGFVFKTIKDYLPGDIDGDGEVGNTDVTRLLQYIAGWEVEVVADALDTNGDGNVNIVDVLRLLKFLSNYSVELE